MHLMLQALHSTCEPQLVYDTQALADLPDQRVWHAQHSQGALTETVTTVVMHTASKPTTWRPLAHGKKLVMMHTPQLV